MEVKKGCLGYLFSFLTMFVLTLVLAGEMKQVQAENCTEHVYDYECDTRCNECGEFRVTDHYFDHYEGNSEKHRWVCDCGYMSNANQHWYDSNEDTSCNECGYMRDLDHDYKSLLHDELYHWKECDCGAKEKKELHTYVNGKCKYCGNQRPSWYDENAHRIKDGIEYVSLKEAAEYSITQLINRNINMELDYYIDSEKIFQDGENQTALYTEMSQISNTAIGGDLIWNMWNGQRNEEEIFDGNTHFYSVKNWMPWYGTTLEQEQELSKEINRILKDLKIDALTEYEKIWAIYQYICENVSYSVESLDYSLESDTHMVTSAYGALTTGYAICDGYADLVYQMMSAAGIDTRVITSHSHAWNIIRLEGIYYCIDATWDAGTDNYPFFLCGWAEFRDGYIDHFEYNQFLTEEFLSKYPISMVSYGVNIPDTNEVIQSGSCGDLTWTLTGTGVFTLKGYGTMNSCTWREWKGLIKKVVVEEGITTICNDAFSSCSALEEVILPSTVTEIRDNAFGYCNRLKEIVLPQKLTSLGIGVFRSCGSLQEVVIPKCVISLGEGAFKNCFSLKKVDISGKISTIEKETFLGCTNLQTVILPEGIKEIYDNAFEGCEGLEELILPTTLKKIGEYVFKDAFYYKAKVSLTLPESVTEVGFQCFEMSDISEVIWNASTKEIPAETFDECRYLKSVIIGNSVKKIGREAFGYCISLENVILPAGLEEVERQAFVFCKSLTNIVISGSLRRVGDEMFMSCTALETITFSKGVEEIGTRAFVGCNNLKKIYFEGDLPRSADIPFVDCKLTICYPASNESWKNRNSIVSGGEISWIAAHGQGETHTYSENNNKEEHWKECTCGDIINVEPHIYATEQSTVCEVCGYERTVTQDVTQEHKHAFNQSFDNNNHWKECTCGDVISVAPHTYATEQSTVCEVCGYERTVATEHKHVYLPAYDKESHWKECECGEIINQNFHVYLDSDSAQCLSCDYSRTGDQTLEEMPWIYDEYTHWKEYEDGSYILEGPHEFIYEQDPDCNICGYIREVEHKHKNVFSYDEESHYMECETCGERSNVNPHAFKSDCSAKCNACKFTREAGEHQYIILAHNAEKHWMECACGLKAEQEEHIWQESKIGNVIMYECEYCDAEKEEYESSDDLLDASEETSKEPSVPSYTDEPSGGNNMVIIISILAAVLLLGGIGFAVVIKKKNKN